MVAPTISNSIPEPDIKLSVLVAVIAGLMTGTVAAYLFSLLLDFHLVPTAIATAKALFSGVRFGELPSLIKNTVYLSSGFAVPAAIVTLILMLRVTTPPGEIHIRGRRLIDDPKLAEKKATREASAESKRLGTGLDIFPGVPLSLERETRHMMILGSIGAGKTTILRPLVDQARARGDKCFIFDNKSDFTQSLPTKDDTGEALGFCLIAPWDSRGYAWDLAADIQNFADAREFATSIIKESHEPIWSNSSIEIFTALIRRCQVKHRDRWTLADVVEPLGQGAEAIQKVVIEHNPQARLLIEDAKSRTTQSMFANLVSCLSPFLSLVDAWSRCKVPGRISIRRWLADDYSGPRTIVMQGNKKYAEVQKSVSQALLRVFSREMNSPSITDVRPDDPRKIWLFLDEFPQLGELNDFSSFMEVSRSKGVRVVMGLQNKAQLTKIYGGEEMESWSSIVGTYLIGRTQGKEIAGWLSDLIGDRKYKKYSPTYSSALYNQTEAPTRTDQYQIIEEAVVSPDEFQSLLGNDKGIKALFLPGGNDVYLLRWPYLDDGANKQRRPASVPARWTSPDFPSAADLIVSDAGNNASNIDSKNASNNKKPGATQRQQKTKTPQQTLPSSNPVVADDHSELKKALGEMAEESAIHEAVEEIPAELFDIATPIGGLKIFTTAIELLLNKSLPAVRAVANQPADQAVNRRKKRRRQLDRDFGQEMN